MSLDTVCYLLAVPGAILTWLGRRLIIIEAASISTGWLWAVRLLPLADLMFLARFWDSAKSGAFVSMAGLACLLPLGGKMLWEEGRGSSNNYLLQARTLSPDQKAQLFGEIRTEHQARIEAKQRKLQQLNAHMSAWYASMNQRRAKLANAAPEQLDQFNVEAAAYQSLHAVTKTEAAELQALFNRKLDSPKDVSAEEYAKHLGEAAHRVSARLKALAKEGPAGSFDSELEE